MRLLVRAEVLPQAQRQVEHGAAAVDIQRNVGQSVELEPGVGVALQGEHDLEKRVTSPRAGGIECRDQAIEGDVLVFVGIKSDGLDPLDQVSQSRVAGDVDAEYQHIDEVPDEIG